MNPAAKKRTPRHDPSSVAMPSWSAQPESVTGDASTPYLDLRSRPIVGQGVLAALYSPRRVSSCPSVSLSAIRKLLDICNMR